MLTRTSTRLKKTIVLNLVIYESEKKAPMKANPFEAARRMVAVVDALATPICMVVWRYVTKFRFMAKETAFKAVDRTVNGKERKRKRSARAN